MKRTLFAVILAGGSGTRFWPASRRLRPKQLLPLGPCAPDSLIGSTVARLSGLVDTKHILVATGAHLVDATRKELSQLPSSAFFAEPMARNTAPCIGWAASVIARTDPDAIVCVLPSDQHAVDADGFRAALAKAAEAADERRDHDDWDRSDPTRYGLRLHSAFSGKDTGSVRGRAFCGKT